MPAQAVTASAGVPSPGAAPPPGTCWAPGPPPRAGTVLELDPGAAIGQVLAGTQFRQLLDAAGAVLLRGTGLRTPAMFHEAARAFGGAPLAYTERSTPRTRVDGALYTATEYPARERIFLHNENAYAARWPRHLMFFCERAADAGGEVLLADTRRIHDAIPPDLRRACEARGLRYLRRFIPGIGYTWQQAFQVENREALAARLAELGYCFAWEGEHLLVERQGSWSARHPRTGEPVWFNHGVFFNARSLDAGLRAHLQRLFGAGAAPFDTAYGDGTALAAGEYEALRQAYTDTSAALRMRAGDVLVVDNLLAAHGREAYTGERKHYVLMLD